MTIAVYLALLAAVAVPVGTRLPVAPWLADHLRPAGAIVVVAVCAVVLALSSTATLVLLVVAGIAAVPALSGGAGPFDGVVGVVRVVLGGVATAALAVLVVRVALATARLVREYRAAAAALPGDAVPGGVVLVPGGGAPARALPVRGGHVVVSETPWRALRASEQAAVLAHERAHLRRRHHLYLVVLAVAVALNPLLGPLLPILDYGLERDADESAAARTGQRHTLAYTIAELALTGRGGPADTGITPGVASSLVVPRVRALLSTERASNDRWGLAVGLAAAVVVLSTLLALGHASVELGAILGGAPCDSDQGLPHPSS